MTDEFILISCTYFTWGFGEADTIVHTLRYGFHQRCIFQ